MTVPFTAADAARWSGGELVRGQAERRLAGVSIDTRTLAGGELFVAIRGPVHDAHDFLAAALEKGAAGLLVERGRALPAALQGELVAIAAPDTTVALGGLAAGHRRSFTGPLVAITGSSGKTTTKEMCAAILSVAGPCLKNEGNLNNEFGLPLSLLRRESQHESAVLELGMSHRGEIARLAEIARPTVGLVTNAGTAHIEHLGSREEIAREKGDLFAALPPDGVAAVNLDDARVAEQGRRAPCAVLRYGRNAEEADVRARSVRALPEGGFAFELESPSGRAGVRVHALGEPTVINAVAAATAALAAGATLEQVAQGLLSYEPISGRMTRIELPGAVTLIDDSYNANPQSVRAALASLADLAGDARSLAVLGDMAELGDAAEDAHRDVGRWAAELGIDLLFALGERAACVRAGALEGGMDAGRIHTGSEHGETARRVRDVLQPRDWVLVKGSRAMKMERVVESLRTGRAA